MKYDKEFKGQALKLSDEIGVKKAAEKLGIKYDTWIYIFSLRIIATKFISFLYKTPTYTS